MGSLLGHIAPGLALAILGVWHTLNTLKTYFLNGPSNFRVAYHFPLNGPSSSLKHADLLLLATFSILAIAMQILDFPFLRLSFELDGFEHATMFLHVAVFSGFTLYADISRSLTSLSGFIGVLAASVFGQELFLLRFHSADHVGIEGHYHWLLQLVVLVSFVAALAAALSPSSFPAGIVLSGSVVFQGLWFVVMGLVLWVPHFAPAGCAPRSADDETVGAIVCGSADADARARAVANLQFSWVVAVIMVFTGVVAARVAGKHGAREVPGEYERLRRKGPEVRIAMDVFRPPHL